MPLLNRKFQQCPPAETTRTTNNNNPNNIHVDYDESNYESKQAKQAQTQPQKLAIQVVGKSMVVAFFLLAIQQSSFSTTIYQSFQLVTTGKNQTQQQRQHNQHENFISSRNERSLFSNNYNHVATSSTPSSSSSLSSKRIRKNSDSLLLGVMTNSIRNGFSHPDNGTSTRNKLRTSLVKQKRVHLCYSDVHAEIGAKILLEEFHNFRSVKLSNKDVSSNNWDLIYGGYPHCGLNHHHKRPLTWDWNMTSGLNNILLKRNKFHNMQSHQVYHPCMGCSKSYCNKFELCKILRDTVDSSACYVLPEDNDRLTSHMKQNPEKVWVLKRDASDIHIHTGRGVEYITSSDQLPSPIEQQLGIFLVQPFNMPFLGSGVFHRKSEIRVYIAITNVYPIRAYTYKQRYVVLAAKEFIPSNSNSGIDNITDIIQDLCRIDTHSFVAQCNNEMPDDFKQTLDEIGTTEMRQLRFEHYAARTNMNREFQDKLMSDIDELLAKVLYNGHGAFENHPINQGIRQSNATCFSHMRADIGISRSGKPFLFEISEFPGLHGHSPLDHDATKDVFSMIGLDTNKKLPIKEREAYELTHLGSYKPLKLPSNQGKIVAA